ncbi:MAG: acetyl-CoA carboxylase carboxyl transferase subunit alpha, partial [Rhizobiales bacterium]|nr:acetyl-CoA carboxylase carboxyl transferase subunit alpha [Hyphomicrobiales bacterium]
MRTFLDFEKPVADLEGQIQELRRLEDGEAESVSVSDEIATLEQKARDALAGIYSKLTPWQKTQVA